MAERSNSVQKRRNTTLNGMRRKVEEGQKQEYKGLEEQVKRFIDEKDNQNKTTKSRGK